MEFPGDDPNNCEVGIFIKATSITTLKARKFTTRYVLRSQRNDQPPLTSKITKNISENLRQLGRIKINSNKIRWNKTRKVINSTQYP